MIKLLTIDAPGLYAGFPIDAYYADPCPVPSLTQSIAKVLIDDSPAHARLKHPRLAPPLDPDEVEPEKYVAAQAIGNAAHAAMIGRGRDVAEGDFPTWMSGDAKKFKAAAIAEGRIPILRKHYTRATAMVEAARSQLDAASVKDAFRKGEGEVLLAWREGDLWFRSLIDWVVSPAKLYDYKTTGISLAPYGLGPMIERAGWHVQAAFQERGLNVIDPAGAGRRTFRFIGQENEPPYALVPVELNEHWMTMGRKKVDRAVALWSRCMATGHWPAYPAEIVTPEYPGWAETKWLQREVEGEHRERETRTTLVPDMLMGG